MKRNILLTLLSACLFLTACSQNSSATISSSAAEDSALQTEVPTNNDTTAFDMNERIGRGINIGGSAQTEESLKTIKDAGFDSVRMLIKWTKASSQEAPYTISEGFFTQIDQTIDLATSQGLVVVLATDGIPKIQFPGDESSMTVEQIEEMYLAIIGQIAEHYQDYSNDLVLELLNEPFNVLGPARLNQLYANTIALVRQTNPDRTLIVGPESLYSVDCLENLRLPEDDRNIIVNIHNYEPVEFAMQGTTAFPSVGATWGSYTDMHAMINDLYKIEAWSNENNRPITINEFGSLGTADINSRVAYTSSLRSMVEMMGFSWMYFEFSGNSTFSNFGIYSEETSTWCQPLLEALIPADDAEIVGPGIPGASSGDGGSGTNGAGNESSNTDSTSDSNSSGSKLDGQKIIKTLVDTGTITQEQGDMIFNAFVGAQGNGGAGGSSFDTSPLDVLVKDGTITQEQADAVVAEITKIFE